MRNTTLSILALSSIAVAACGGGGGGGSSAPGAPPAPPPTNSSLTNLQFTETFESTAAAIAFDIIGGNVTNASAAQTDLSSASTIRYNAANDSFTISYSENGENFNTTFGPNQINTAESDDTVTLYENGDDFVIALVQDNPLVPLTYVGFGSWGSAPASGDSLNGYSVYGVQTPDNDMPVTGIVTYEGPVVGTLISGSEFFTLSGAVEFTANFATNNVDILFGASRSLDGVGTPTPWDFFTSTASIASGTNTFSGALSGLSDTSLTGDLNGGFFGPSAQEIGATWLISNSTDTAVGALVGTRN